MELSKFRALSFFSDRNKAGCRDTRTNLVKSPPAEQGARLCVLPFAKKVCLFAKITVESGGHLQKKLSPSIHLLFFSEARVTLCKKRWFWATRKTVTTMALAVVSRRAAASAVTAGGRLSQLSPSSACFKSSCGAAPPTRGHTSEAETKEQVQSGNGNGNGNGARARYILYHTIQTFFNIFAKTQPDENLKIFKTKTFFFCRNQDFSQKTQFLATLFRKSNPKNQN